MALDQNINTLEKQKFIGDSDSQVSVSSNDPSTRTHRQLFNYQYLGTSYANLNIITNNKSLAITLNDGSLIYKG